MRIRALSSIVVAVVGLIPIVAGGPWFALLMAMVGLVGYREFLWLAARRTSVRPPAVPGYVAISLFAAAGWLRWGVIEVVAIVAGASLLPLTKLLADAPDGDGLTAWAIAVAGTLYLGLPLFATTTMRSLPGAIASSWLADLARSTPGAGVTVSRGLAWTLLVVLAIWIGDSTAYLWGRSFGRRTLAPSLSPNKTVEGALAGLLGAAATGVAGSALFGLALPVPLACGYGLMVGLVGQVGDLAESFLKRQAGVKDSGRLIPGHGGILDRIDALLFAFPVGWFLAALVDRAPR